MTAKEPTGNLWQRTSTWFCLSTVGVLCVLIINFVDQGHARIVEPDEAAWIYSGYFYHLAFQKQDLGSADWKHRDCLDHPPVAKYVFGAVAAFDGYVVDSVDLKEWLFDVHFHVNPRTITQALHDEIPQSTLYRGRLASTALFALSCTILFWIGAAAFGPRTAALAAILTATCPIVLDLSSKVMAEAPLFLLLLLLVWAQIGWLKHRDGTIRSLAWRAIWIGMLIAFLANTKLNGLVGLPCALGAIVASIPLWMLHARDEATLTTSRMLAGALLSATLVTAAFLIALIAINPSLYSDPIEFVHGMFEHRWQRLNFQMKAYYLGSLPSGSLVMAGVVRGLLFANDWLFAWWSIPVLLFLFLLGVGGLPADFARSRHGVLVVLLNFAVWGSATFYTYRMDWDRYLLPLVPFVMLLAAAGVTHCFRMLRDLGRPAHRLGWVLFAAVVTAGLSWFQGRWTIQNQLDRDPRPLIDAYRQAMLLKPDHAAGYIRLGQVLLAVQENVDEAKRMYLRGLELNPDYAEGHQGLGEILLLQNQPTKGLTHLRRSLELYPDNPSALIATANALLQMDQVEAQAG